MLQPLSSQIYFINSSNAKMLEPLLSSRTKCFLIYLCRYLEILRIQMSGYWGRGGHGEERERDSSIGNWIMANIKKDQEVVFFLTSTLTTFLNMAELWGFIDIYGTTLHPLYIGLEPSKRPTAVTAPLFDKARCTAYNLPWQKNTHQNHLSKSKTPNAIELSSTILLFFNSLHYYNI